MARRKQPAYPEAALAHAFAKDKIQTAVFYGASDDLIEVEGVKGADEFNGYERGHI